MKFFKKNQNSITCLLCSHYCNLKENQVGICRVNKNINQKLVNLVYSKVSAINIDNIEKKPLYHFLPNTKTFSIGTIGCNFKCPFCQNHSISQIDDLSKTKEISIDDIIALTKQYNCPSISYTYNEPTIFYPFIEDIAIKAKQNNIKNIFVTNGFASKELIDDIENLIDAANIDLKSFDKRYYKKELFGNLDIILRNIELFYKKNIHIEITTLIIPTINENDIENIAKFIASINKDIPLHLSAYHTDYKLNIPNTSKDILFRAKEVAKKYLNFVYLGNIMYENNTYCRCGDLMVNRIGFKAKVYKLKCDKCNFIIK